jgi:hypothetical protein
MDRRSTDLSAQDPSVALADIMRFITFRDWCGTGGIALSSDR